MTAEPIEFYVREGSRFVRADQATPRIPEHPPIPVPMRVVHEERVEEAPVERSSFVAVPAPKCPHGSFVRWAKRNCCKGRLT